MRANPHEFIKVQYLPLLGRPFVYGSNDCYGLARDFYKLNWDIDMTDYARADGWISDGGNLIMDHLHDEGFFVAHDPPHKVRPGDGLLVSIRSDHPCHIGMYLGNNTVLHHRQGQFSRTTPFSGVFRSGLCAIVRHPKVVLPEETGTIHILDLIPPHKRAALAALYTQSRPVQTDPKRQKGPSGGPESGQANIPT